MHWTILLESAIYRYTHDFWNTNIMLLTKSTMLKIVQWFTNAIDMMYILKFHIHITMVDIIQNNPEYSNLHIPQKV